MLVERAYLDNLDIAAAVARIEQADANTRIAGAPLLPLIEFDGSVTRSGTGTGPGVTTHSAVLNASYELDFWGKNRALLRAAEFGAIASRFDREVIVLSTVASVINTYFQVLAAQDRLRIARDNVERGDPHPESLSGPRRRRHRDRPRHRAAGIAGGAAARRDPAARSAAHARTSRRWRCCSASRPSRLTVRGGSLNGIVAQRVSPGLPSDLLLQRPGHPRGRGAACRRQRQCARARAPRCCRAFRSPGRAALSAPRCTRCSCRSPRSIRSPAA